MLVRFLNSGYGTDDGNKNVEMVKMQLGFLDAPEMVVRNPYDVTGTLVARFRLLHGSHQWVCDLD